MIAFGPVPSRRLGQSLGINQVHRQGLQLLTGFVGQLATATAYLAVPTRPPAELWVRQPTESVIARAYQVFRAWHPRVELLVGAGAGWNLVTELVEQGRLVEVEYGAPTATSCGPGERATQETTRSM